MACQYKFNGVILSEEQFQRLVFRASELVENTATSEKINIVNVANTIASLNLTEFNEESIMKIQALNDLLQEHYNTDFDFVSINEEGTVVLNQDVFDSVNMETDENALIENAMNEILFNQPNTLTGYSYDPSVAKPNRFAKMVAYKQSLINKLEKQRATLIAAKAKYDPKSKEFGDILKLEKEIDKRLNGYGYETDADYIPGLLREVQKLKSEDNIDILFDYFNSDVQRLAALTERSDIDSISESKIILAFFKALHSTDSSGSNKSVDNPILDMMELSDDRMKDSIKRIKDFSRNIIDIYEDKIKQKEVDILNEVIKNDPDLRKLFPEEELEYQTFFGRMLAMEDVNIYDAVFMDGTIGTFSDFGHIPQLAKKMLTESITKYRAKESSWEEKMSVLIPKVNAKLQKLGYAIKIVGFKYGASYTLFRQKYANGQYTNRMVDRYSADYIDEWARIQNEYRSAIDRAKKGLKGAAAIVAKRNAHINRDNWRRTNTINVDPRKISEFINNPDFAEFKEYFIDDNGNHENELKTHLMSDNGYKEAIAEQKEKIYRFQTERKRLIQTLFEQQGVKNFSDLDSYGQFYLKQWDADNNPFTASRYFETNIPITLNGYAHYPDMNRFSTFIPKRTNNGKETGNYDKNFATIESDEDLYEFWKLSDEIFTECRKHLPLDKQREMAYNTIAGKEKSWVDILTDPDLTLGEKFVQAITNMKDSFKQSFTSVESSKFSNNKLVDVITNQEDSDVSLKLIQTNGDEIKRNFVVQAIQFIQSLNGENRRIFTNAAGKLTMNKYSKVPYSALSHESKELLASYLNVPSGDKSLLKALNITQEGNVDIGKLIYRNVVSRIVENETFNLPQILKLYSKGAMLYAARTEVKPKLDILKEHYNNIKRVNTTNAGTFKNTFSKLTRTSANDNFEKWFHKHVIGDVSPKVLGLIKNKMMAKLRKNSEGKNEWMFNIALSSLTNEEKDLYRIIQDEIERENALGEHGSAETIKELKAIQERLGRNFAAGAFVDRFFDLTRMVGLALSPVGAFYNFMAGKFTNYINANVYYSEAAMIRAERIVLGSHVKIFGVGKISDNTLKSAKKLAIMMNRFKVFQDSSDEIYKSSIDTAVNLQSAMNLYILQSRTEYVNQAPVLAALMIDEKIKDIDGNESSVWDALDHNGKLLEKFRTPENIANWETADSKEANRFIEKTTATIKQLHGDYSELGGSVYSENQAYKAVMMFKRWMPRYIHSRFAKEYYDHELGRWTKGRYQSVNMASATAIVGTTTLALLGFNPVGLLAISGAAVWGYTRRDTTSELNYFKELTINLAQIFTKAAILPPKVLYGIGTGKKLFGDSKFNQFLDNGNRTSDTNNGNMTANINEASLIVMTLMMRLIIMGMFKDRDEDEDDSKLNLALNMCGRMLNELTLFQNPLALWDGLVGSPAALRTIQNMIKFGESMSDFFEGNDMVTEGVDAGESKINKAIQKVIYPSIFRDDFGFGSGMKKVNDQYGLDQYMLSEKKQMEKLLRTNRLEYRKELEKKYTEQITPELISSVADQIKEANPEISDALAKRKAEKLIQKEIEKNALKMTNYVLPTLSYRDKDITKEQLKEDIKNNLEEFPPQ